MWVSGINTCSHVWILHLCSLRKNMFKKVREFHVVIPIGLCWRFGVKLFGLSVATLGDLCLRSSWTQQLDLKWNIESPEHKDVLFRWDPWPVIQPFLLNPLSHCIQFCCCALVLHSASFVALQSRFGFFQSGCVGPGSRFTQSHRVTQFWPTSFPTGVLLHKSDSSFCSACTIIFLLEAPILTLLQSLLYIRVGFLRVIPSGSFKRPVLQIVQALQKRTVIGTFDWEKRGHGRRWWHRWVDLKMHNLWDQMAVTWSQTQEAMKTRFKRLGPGSRFRPLA